MANTKIRVTKKQVSAHRSKANRDMSPSWDSADEWTGDRFTAHFRTAMEYYRMEYSARDLKPKVVEWMHASSFARDDIQAFKKTKDFRCSGTMGGVAACLVRGMPEIHEGFNNGKDTGLWLREQIYTIINQGKDDYEPEVVEDKSTVPMVSIQDRVKESSLNMTVEIEDAIESFSNDPDSFDPKAFKVLNLLKGKQAKAAHARIIRDYYIRDYNELQEALTGGCDQLKEAYGHLSKANLKKIIAFYSEIISACDMLMQEAKVNRKPRAKKSKPVEKIVEKLKYMKQDPALRLVSVNPADIVGAKELWVFNTKTRKLGKYVAGEFNDLSVKGTSITGFDEFKSVQKTLRKPEDQLKEFKNAGKVALRKFLEDIKAVDIKLNGRINEDTVLLKTQ